MKYKITLTTKPGQLPVGTVITLYKEVSNIFDGEAISVFSAGEKVGYVSAFYKTRKPGTFSAGRIYDKLGYETKAVVVADQIAEVEGRE